MSSFVKAPRWADRACDQMLRPPGPPGKLDSRRIDSPGLRSKAVFLQPKRVGPEGVGLHKIASDRQIGFVELLNRLWPRQIPKLWRFPRLETSGLKHRSDRSVGHQDPPSEPFAEPGYLSGGFMPARKGVRRLAHNSSGGFPDNNPSRIDLLPEDRQLLWRRWLEYLHSLCH